MENNNLHSLLVDQLNTNTYLLNSGWYIRTYHKLYTSKNLSADLLEKRIKKDIKSHIVLSLFVLIALIDIVITLFGHTGNPNFVNNAEQTMFLSILLLIIIVSQIYTIFCFNKLLHIYRFNSFLQKINLEIEKEE